MVWLRDPQDPLTVCRDFLVASIFKAANKVQLGQPFWWGRRLRERFLLLLLARLVQLDVDHDPGRCVAHGSPLQNKEATQ